jgi:AcrR family transcriptional regulator
VNVALPSDLAWQERSAVRSIGPAQARALEAAARAVKAARRLASETGSPAFTVQQVVDTAGISLKSFYRHFAGKDDLLLAVFEEDNRRGAEALRVLVEEHEDPLERLRACVVGLFGFIAAGDRQYMAVMIREHLRLAEQRSDELRHVLAPFFALLRRELDAAIAAGAVRRDDAARDAAIVFNLVLAHIHAVLLGHLAEDPAELGEYLWEFCRRALAPSPEPQQPA